jgi:hypothetical protein
MKRPFLIVGIVKNEYVRSVPALSSRIQIENSMENGIFVKKKWVPYGSTKLRRIVNYMKEQLYMVP